MISNKFIGMNQYLDLTKQLQNYINKIGIITKVIFWINICVFIIQSLVKINNVEYVVWLLPIIEGQFYRIITATFSHAGLLHILLNMFSLVLSSPIIEAHHGTVDFLIINVFLYNVVGKR